MFNVDYLVVCWDVDPLLVSVEATFATKRYNKLQLDLKSVQTPYLIYVSRLKKLEPWERTRRILPQPVYNTARLQYCLVLNVSERI
ncbi:hypothetical protein N7451_008969 [Penicillium sp. IBT 35674x]|nr:hypothetical protein N7451_008969 [Penicillium sp. IBT 35674x]